jgi:hypothetical protein
MFGNHYGYECWDDPGFIKAIHNHFPETKVASKGDNPTIVVPDISSITRFSKWHKVYPAQGGALLEIPATPHGARAATPAPA